MRTEVCGDFEASYGDPASCGAVVAGTAIGVAAMQATLHSTQHCCRPQVLRSQSVNVSGPVPFFAPRPHRLCRAHLHHQSHGHSFVKSRHVDGARQKCQASQSEASIDKDADLVGEDAAFFDVEKQTTKSWTLFTGLLLGVLGLIYVVRLAVQEHR